MFRSSNNTKLYFSLWKRMMCILDFGYYKITEDRSCYWTRYQISILRNKNMICLLECELITQIRSLAVIDLDMPFLPIYCLRKMGNIYTSKLRLLSKLNSLDNWNTHMHMCMYVSIKLNAQCENATGKSVFCFPNLWWMLARFVVCFIGVDHGVNYYSVWARIPEGAPN